MLVRQIGNKPLSKFGFTLAEVLITLGIIGIVAAMTIPTLMNKTNDAELKTAWKKEYSVINSAFTEMKNDNGGDLSIYFNRTPAEYMPDPFINEFSTYFATLNKCLMITDHINYACGNGATLANAYLTLSGSYVNNFNLYYGNFTLRDGAQVYFRTYDSPKFIIWVDVNGFRKRPNTLGRDLFGAVITQDKITPLGSVDSGLQDTCSSVLVNCGGGHNGFYDGSGSCAGAGCSAEYLYK